MKFYLASSFGRKRELQRYVDDLDRIGHVCTSRWIITEHEADVGDDKTGKDLMPTGPGFVFATEDIEDIRSADALVFFSSRDLNVSNGRGGRHTEFGYALAVGKPIFFIGVRENAFHSLIPATRMFADWRAFILLMDYVVQTIRAFQAAERIN